MRSLLVVVCGAGPAGEVHRLVTAAQRRGWAPVVTATPSAMTFIDAEAIAEAAGSAVRSEYQRETGQPERPAFQALIVAPATFNTVNKLAHGIADNYALTSIAGHIGAGLPTIIVPFVNSALAGRTPFVRSVAMLRAEGVRVLFGPEDGRVPHPPGSGAEHFASFPWEQALIEAERMSAT